MSENINESKKREVFVCNYQANEKYIIINDTLKLTVDVIWLEKKWAYSSHSDETIITSGYQLIVHTASELDEDYSFTWSIGTNFKRYFRSCGFSCIITDFDSLPNKIETWQIQKGRVLREGTSHVIIGEFTLYRKE